MACQISEDAVKADFLIYNTSTKYWLVVLNTKSETLLFKHQVIMDIAFADDFGFGNVATIL